MSSHKELLEKKAELEAQIEQRLAEERPGDLETVRELVAKHRFNGGDVFCGGMPITGTIAVKTKRKSATIKYRGPNGETWSGRGRSPAWIVGDKADYVISPAP